MHCKQNLNHQVLFYSESWQKVWINNEGSQERRKEKNRFIYCIRQRLKWGQPWKKYTTIKKHLSRLNFSEDAWVSRKPAGDVLMNDWTEYSPIKKRGQKRFHFIKHNLLIIFWTVYSVNQIMIHTLHQPPPKAPVLKHKCWTVPTHLSNSNILFITGLEVLTQFTRTESCKTSVNKGNESVIKQEGIHTGHVAHHTFTDPINKKINSLTSLAAWITASHAEVLKKKNRMLHQKHKVILVLLKPFY